MTNPCAVKPGVGVGPSSVLCGVGVGVEGSISDGGVSGGGPPIKPFGVNVGASAKGSGEVSGVGIC